MPQKLEADYLRTQEPDNWMTAVDAKLFCKRLARLGFVVARCFAYTRPGGAGESVEMPADDIIAAGITDPVEMDIVFSGHAEGGAITAARMLRLLDPEGLGPTLNSYASAWAVLNPGRARSDAFAAALSIRQVYDGATSGLRFLW